jgi:ABC-type glycerol-3-phosphate transport system permease component
LLTTAVLMVADAAFDLAFAVWIISAYFGSIPVELEEAVMMDGCGRARARQSSTGGINNMIGARSVQWS